MFLIVTVTAAVRDGKNTDEDDYFFVLFVIVNLIVATASVCDNVQ